VDFVSRGGAVTYFYVFRIPSGLIQEWYVTVNHGYILLSLYKFIIYDETEVFHHVWHKHRFGHFILRNVQAYKIVLKMKVMCSCFIISLPNFPRFSENFSKGECGLKILIT
jgi:hypothetical protein